MVESHPLIFRMMFGHHTFYPVYYNAHRVINKYPEQLFLSCMYGLMTKTNDDRNTADRLIYLAMTKDQRAIPVLQQYKYHTQQDIQTSALVGLYILGHKAISQDLKQYIHADDQNRSVAFLEAIEKVVYCEEVLEDDLVDLVIELIKSKDNLVRVMAIHLLYLMINKYGSMASDKIKREFNACMENKLKAKKKSFTQYDYIVHLKEEFKYTKDYHLKKYIINILGEIGEIAEYNFIKYIFDEYINNFQPDMVYAMGRIIHRIIEGKVKLNCSTNDDFVDYYVKDYLDFLLKIKGYSIYSLQPSGNKNVKGVLLNIIESKNCVEYCLFSSMLYLGSERINSSIINSYINSGGQATLNMSNYILNNMTFHEDYIIEFALNIAFSEYRKTQGYFSDFLCHILTYRPDVLSKIKDYATSIDIFVKNWGSNIHGVCFLWLANIMDYQNELDDLCNALLFHGKDNPQFISDTTAVFLMTKTEKSLRSLFKNANVFFNSHNNYGMEIIRYIDDKFVIKQAMEIFNDDKCIDNRRAIIHILCKYKENAIYDLIYSPSDYENKPGDRFEILNYISEFHNGAKSKTDRFIF